MQGGACVGLLGRREVALRWEGLGDVDNEDMLCATTEMNTNSRLQRAARSLVPAKYMRLPLTFLSAAHLGLYFMSAGRKAASGAGGRAELGEEGSVTPRSVLAQVRQGAGRGVGSWDRTAGEEAGMESAGARLASYLTGWPVWASPV